MQNEILKLKNFGYENEIAKKHSQIHSQREGSDSPGDFGFEKTRKVDPRTLPKIFKEI
jgi:hypothetical protein